jgi:hypothetical protein
MSNKLFQILIIIGFITLFCRRSEGRDVLTGVEVNGVKNHVISLNGKWKFSINPPSHFWENSIEFSGWPDSYIQ